MMHEREKSDLSTVAVKAANASGRSEGESVERREGAEGNTVEDRTRRTPRRVSVYSGLDFAFHFDPAHALIGVAHRFVNVIVGIRMTVADPWLAATYRTRATGGLGVKSRELEDVELRRFRSPLASQEGSRN